MNEWFILKLIIFSYSWGAKYIQKYTCILEIAFQIWKNQLSPRHEGLLIFMAEPIPHPKRPPRTPSRRSSFFAADGWAETDSSILRHAAPLLRTNLHAVSGGGVVYVAGPVRPPHSAPNVNYFLLGWWSTDRHLTVHNVREMLGVQPRSGILAFFFPLQQLAVNNGRAPHYQRAPRAGCCSGGRPPRSCPPGFGPGTTMP